MAKLTEMQRKLVNESTFVIRETKALFKKPIILWAGGKDSTTTVHLIKKAFNNKVPWPVVQLDTGYKFRETYDYMHRIAKAWDLDFRQVKNKEAMTRGINPFKNDRFQCCSELKTNCLNNFIKEYKADAVIVSIRWDEHGVRGKEQHFSPRDDPKHCRVHPVLNWAEKDIWTYLRSQNIPYNPLYDRVEHGNLVYRSIGCYPCTKPIPKDQFKLSERAGRAQDKEEIMEQLRALGYM